MLNCATLVDVVVGMNDLFMAGTAYCVGHFDWITPDTLVRVDKASEELLDDHFGLIGALGVVLMARCLLVKIETAD